MSTASNTSAGTNTRGDAETSVNTNTSVNTDTSVNTNIGARTTTTVNELSPQALSQLVASVKEEVVQWRRHLHQNPELSFQEEKTSQYVYDILESFGGLELSRPTKTSVVARLIGTKGMSGEEAAVGEGAGAAESSSSPPKIIAIRADMDALPIVEDTEFEFKSSNPGVMHACGHDGHTAMLLGTAKILSGLKEHIRGEIRFLFQHAEELFPGGASQMVAAGVMEGVQQVIGIHLKSQMETGIVSVAPGPVNAAPDTFRVTILGSGGHAAYPHNCVDSVLIAAQAITNLQHVVSRYADPLDPLVLSVTRIVGGTADNVIPGSVEFGGTVRSYNPTLRNQVPEWMERTIKGVTEAHGATYEFEYTRGYDPVVNDTAVTAVVEETLRGVFGDHRVINAPPTMGGEDFSAFQKAAPGTFFQVGAGYGPKEKWHPHHHPKFAINEEALPIGVESFVNLAFRLLED